MKSDNLSHNFVSSHFIAVKKENKEIEFNAEESFVEKKCVVFERR